MSTYAAWHSASVLELVSAIRGATIAAIARAEGSDPGYSARNDPDSSDASDASDSSASRSSSQRIASGPLVTRRPLASVAACRKKAMAPALEALEDCGVRPYRVEPAPCGLLRRAIERHRTPRRCASALRVFLGQEHALAVLTAADLPLMWRYFPLPAGSEAMAILSTYDLAL